MLNTQCDSNPTDAHASKLQLRKSFSDRITEYEWHISYCLFLDTIATVRIVLECVTIIYIRVRASVERPRLLLNTIATFRIVLEYMAVIYIRVRAIVRWKKESLFSFEVVKSNRVFAGVVCFYKTAEGRNG